MTLPQTMRAVAIAAPGGPDTLVPTRRPRPSPGPGEVLIQVAAAGVNRPDVLQRLGRYQPPPGVSDLPGLEVAGVIADAAPDVTGWKPGDPVCALLAGGGYAEYCVAPAVQCLPIPAGLDATAAAALPETVFTVWANVFERGRLREGERLLVHGGSSGIGTMAIQMAAAGGARVMVTAGSREKCDACLRLGAERTANYREQDFVAVARDWTDGRGVDVILDMVGGSYLPRNLEALAIEGRLVQIAVLDASKAELNLTTLLYKRLTLTGSTLRPRSPAEKGAIARALLEHVWPWIEAGRVRPVLHATFPLERAAEAHRVMESSAHVGKLVLIVKPS
jgi:putative PIG3 family NAD(P)H quinone oxidoreductase